MSIAPRARIWADVATEAVKNLGMSFPPLRAWGARRRRTMGDHREVTSQLLEDCVFTPLDAIIAEISRERLRGATVIEIGPGDNLVLGFLLLALGAHAYHAIDRFLGDVNGVRARRLYAAVCRELPPRFGISAADFSDARNFPAGSLGDKVFVYRQGVEQFRSMPLAEKADLVFSNDVGQFVASPGALASATAYFLKPGGMALHTVQFGPVGRWTRYRNPLTFLTVPQWIWPWTSSHRGSANRARHHEFLDVFKKAGLVVETKVLEEFGSAELEEARPHLDRRFALAPPDSLRVRFGKFVCRKPEEESKGQAGRS